MRGNSCEGGSGGEQADVAPYYPDTFIHQRGRSARHEARRRHGGQQHRNGRNRLPPRRHHLR
ncbi:MAG: hypothetical protein LC793_08870 [Thermomicrobia bacterium]|nr:hypothetical protein [Thermomicrobia bacterium]